MEKAEYPQKADAHYSKIINYIEAMRFHYGNDALFICGYEAGCLGYTLYHQLTDHGLKCVILAPTTMLQQRGKKKVKTDKCILSSFYTIKPIVFYNFSALHFATFQKDIYSIG